jgi:hypothetical protein
MPQHPVGTISCSGHDSGAYLTVTAAGHFEEPLIYRVAAAYEDVTAWTRRHPPL